MATFVNTKAFCQVCKVSTNKRCIVCKTTYYCSGVCKKKDAKNHKKECTEHIKVLNRDERDERLITGAMEKLKLPTSFQEITPFRSIKQMCEIACEVFHRDVISEKEGLSYKGSIPLGIKSVESKHPHTEETRVFKHYFLQEVEGMKVSESMKAFADKNFTERDFWTTFCISKPSTFCGAFISMLRQLELVHGYVFTYEGEKVTFYGIATTKIKKEFDYVVPTYSWTKKSPTSSWDCDWSHSTDQPMCYIRLETGVRVLIDFAGVQFGLNTYTSSGYPLWISTEDDAKDILDVRTITPPSEVDKIREKNMALAKTTGDVRPFIIEAYKKSMLEVALSDN